MTSQALLLPPSSHPTIAARLSAAVVAALVADLDLRGVTTTRCPDHDAPGLHAYQLARGAGEVLVLVPRVPLGQVRPESGKSTFHLRPLFINGYRWWWPHAVALICDLLTTHDPLPTRRKIAAVPTKTPPPAPRDTTPCPPPADDADWTDEPTSGEQVIPQPRLAEMRAEWLRLECGRREVAILDTETEDSEPTYPGSLY